MTDEDIRRMETELRAAKLAKMREDMEAAERFRFPTQGEQEAQRAEDNRRTAAQQQAWNESMEGRLPAGVDYFSRVAQLLAERG